MTNGAGIVHDGCGGLYAKCLACSAWVKLNKTLFGSLHICEEVPPRPSIPSDREVKRRAKKKAQAIRKQHRRVQKHCCCTSIGDPGYYDLDGELIPCLIHPRRRG